MRDLQNSLVCKLTLLYSNNYKHIVKLSVEEGGGHWSDFHVRKEKNHVKKNKQKNTMFGVKF